MREAVGEEDDPSGKLGEVLPRVVVAQVGAAKLDARGTPGG